MYDYLHGHWMQTVAPVVSSAVWSFVQGEYRWAVEHKELITAMAVGSWRAVRSLRSLRPKLVADIVEKVNLHADGRMELHEQKDDYRFEIQAKEIDLKFKAMTQLVQQSTRRLADGLMAGGHSASGD